MIFLKKFFEFIKENFVKVNRNSIILEFFKEIEEYQSNWKEVSYKVLGKEKAEKVLQLEKLLLNHDSYIFKKENLKNFIPIGFSIDNNLLFYVIVNPEELDKVKIKSNGEIDSSLRDLKTALFFFFNPKILKKHVEEIRQTSLPPYFSLWLHEYCHFIGYCLQKKPIAIAIAILYHALFKASNKVFNIRNMTTLINSRKEVISEIAKTIFYLQGLDEDMANYLRELILLEMGFETMDYSKLTKGTFFYPYFKDWGLSLIHI